MERGAALRGVFTPVAAQTTFEETVERLGTAIRLGLLAPGSRLPAERELADQLEISRSTLRQAITTLVQSGHLVVQRGRTGGTFVTDSPPLAEEGHSEPLGAEARAVLDERVAVEAGAVILACERADKEDIVRLVQLVDRMDEVRDFEDYRRADIRFHIGVAEAARSPRLVAVATEVQGRMSELIARIAHPEYVLSQSNGQHRKLVGLMADKHCSRAVALMRAHIEGTEHILGGLMPGGD
jgi:DNA-binding FadR family transcriptional regulator